MRAFGGLERSWKQTRAAREAGRAHLLDGAGDPLRLVGLGLGLGGVRGSIAQRQPRFRRLLVGFRDGPVDGGNPL